MDNNEIERYSLNIAHYFLEKHDYAFINLQEKILENFNHDYYNIIYIYSLPLINDVNIDALYEKLSLIKKNLRKQFFVFHQRILVIATNCTIDLSKIDFPPYVDVINGSNDESLFNNEIVKTLFPSLINYPLDKTLGNIAININEINIKYAKKIGNIFNKKQFIISILFIFMIIGIYFYNSIINLDNKYVDIIPYIILTKENILHHQYYTLLTNSLLEVNLFWLFIDIFFLFSLGIRLEKIFGSLRYFLILLLSIIFTNALNFAFNYNNYTIGFTSIIYAFVGMFTYVVIMYRRFLVHILKSIIIFNLFLLFIFVLFGNFSSLITFFGAFLTGFIGAFIVNIPDTKYGKTSHRVLSLVFIFILISLLVSLGLK